MADELKELIKNIPEDDVTVPSGMPQFMARVYDKSKRLALPLIIVGGVTAGIATGGIAAAPLVLGICGGSIKLLNVIRSIYKKKHGSSESTDLQGQIGEFAEDISEQIRKVETSVQSSLNDIKLSLQIITDKLNNLIERPDKKIEDLFSDIQAKLKDKRYEKASQVLSQINFEEMRLESHVMREQAEELIMKELEVNGKEGALRMYYYLLQLRQKLELLIQMKHFLTDMNDGSNSSMQVYLDRDSLDYLQDLEGYWEITKVVFCDKIKIPTVVVLGKYGTGKSTLCNVLAGLADDADTSVDGFTTSRETEACTQESTLKETCFFGDPTRSVRILDTPGFDDPSKNHDAEIITNFVEVLKNEVHGVNLILLALNGQSPRLEGSLLAMIKIIRGMFSPEIWNNLAVVFTRVPMDRAKVKRRSKNDPNYDENVAQGFLKTIKEKFNPPRNSKKIEYLYMDAHFDEDNEEERKAFEESKEKLWRMINGNAEFNTNYVEEVMTEYASLKDEIKKRDTELTRTSTIMRQFTQNEEKHIQRENDETRTPVNGLTFLRIREHTLLRKYEHIEDYSLLIREFGNSDVFERPEAFCDQIRAIEKAEESELDFVAHQCDLLQSDILMDRIPRRNLIDKVSQMVFILEITNYTNHFLRNLKIQMREGNTNPLAVWDADYTTLAKPSMLHCRQSFLIPPFTKERLIFRNSGVFNKTTLAGIITLDIVGNTYESIIEKRMMVSFKISGSTKLIGLTSFVIGFPDNNEAMSYIKKAVEQQNPEFCSKIKFSKNIKKESNQPQNVRFPAKTVPGGFNLSGVFDQSKHSRGVVFLSKTRAN